MTFFNVNKSSHINFSKYRMKFISKQTQVSKAHKSNLWLNNKLANVMPFRKYFTLRQRKNFGQVISHILTIKLPFSILNTKES